MIVMIAILDMPGGTALSVPQANTPRGMEPLHVLTVLGVITKSNTENHIAIIALWLTRQPVAVNSPS
jgi:hypothetical protein